VTDRGPDRPAAGAEEALAYQRRCKLLRQVFDDFDSKGVGLRMSENLPREALYDRGAAKAEAAAERERPRSDSDTTE